MYSVHLKHAVRPIGVTIIAILYALVGISLALAPILDRLGEIGAIPYGLGEIFALVLLLSMQLIPTAVKIVFLINQHMEIVSLGLLWLAIGSILVIIAHGLRTLKKWARIVVIVFSALGILIGSLGLIQLFVAAGILIPITDARIDPISQPRIPLTIISVIINLIPITIGIAIIRYMMKSNVKAAFK